MKYTIKALLLWIMLSLPIAPQAIVLESLEIIYVLINSVEITQRYLKHFNQNLALEDAQRLEQVNVEVNSLLKTLNEVKHLPEYQQIQMYYDTLLPLNAALNRTSQTIDIFINRDYSLPLVKMRSLYTRKFSEALGLLKLIVMYQQLSILKYQLYQTLEIDEITDALRNEYQNTIQSLYRQIGPAITLINWMTVVESEAEKIRCNPGMRDIFSLQINKFSKTYNTLSSNQQDLYNSLYCMAMWQSDYETNPQEDLFFLFLQLFEIQDLVDYTHYHHAFINKIQNNIYKFQKYKSYLTNIYTLLPEQGHFISYSLSQGKQYCGIYWDEHLIGGNYEGFCQAGLAHGLGQIITENFIYKGYFIAGKPEGLGVYYQYDHKISYGEEILYLGEWKAGKFHGLGQYRQHNKIYSGTWKTGMTDGHGKELTFSDTLPCYGLQDCNITLYHGYWKGGEKHGKGTYFIKMNSNNPIIYKEKWKNNQRTQYKLLSTLDLQQTSIQQDDKIIKTFNEALGLFGTWQIEKAFSMPHSQQDLDNIYLSIIEQNQELNSILSTLETFIETKQPSAAIDFIPAIRIETAEPDTLADNALQSGDYIIKINNKPCISKANCQYIIRSLNTDATITLIREGNIKTIHLALENQDIQQDFTYSIVLIPISLLVYGLN